ncbi:MAG: dihydrolipoyllysine-residue succinyltransferase [Gammaproteobacteria bacterium]|nr:dihydrolipoyllysine-residue succinyltransferase [Gammaproteobacteria bacterium]
MKVEVRVPMLSDSMASGTLLPWRKQAGERVARDEALVDLETDKVILEIPAPASGTLLELRLLEGAVVKADEVVAVIETSDALDTPIPPVQPAPVAASEPPPQPATGVRAALIKTPVSAAVSAPSVPFPGTQQVIQSGETRREPMSRLRSRVAERLVAAQHSAAMLTTFNEVNMQPVNELRQRYKSEFEVRYGVKLGYMSFFVRAVCQALGQFPIVNAAIDGNDIVWHGDVDIGIAISSPRGLVVPILRRAQTLSSAEVERAIADFGLRARASKLTLDDLSGGSFSITNGGVFGSLLSTPILNPPQSAILGMHAIQERPIAENGQVVIRPMMYLALTYDHRLIDGRDAVQFLVAVKAALEAPEPLLTGD